MKRLILLVVLSIVVLGVVAGGPVPRKKGLTSWAVTSEQITSCGYECDLEDGYLGPDEDLTWMAGGSLAPGESFTYTYEPNLGARHISAHGYSYKGRETPLQVEIVTSRGNAIGMTEQCFVFYNSVPAVTNWTVTIRNTSDRLVRRAALWGRNEWERGQSCP